MVGQRAHLTSKFYCTLDAVCGTLKCENAAICEKVAKCEKKIQRYMCYMLYVPK